MTDRLTFEVFGASDDLVEVQGDITEEYSVFVGGSALLRLARRDGAGVFIHGRYVAPGCWMLGVSPIDEGVPVPDGWSFELDRDPVVPHSMRLRVDVDPSAALTLVEGD